MSAQPRPLAVGVVYSSDGSPRIEKDFLDHLHPAARGAVKTDLQAHGWRLNDDNTLEKLNGNDLDSGS